MDFITVTLLFIVALMPLFVAYFKKNATSRKRMVVLNLVSMAAMIVMMMIVSMTGVFAGEAKSAVAPGYDTAIGIGFIAAAMATGLSGLGGGIAVAGAASAALGAISENERIFGKALIMVVLAEGIALYGLLVAVMILGKLPVLA